RCSRAPSPPECCRDDSTNGRTMTSTRDMDNDATLVAMQEELAQLRAEVDAWRARYEKGQVRDIASTNSAREVEPLYSALDLVGSAGTAFEVPGTFPYTRGIHPTGYRGKLWTMRQ